MKRSKWGMHCANHKPLELDRLLSLNLDNYVIVDEWHQLSRIRDARPDSLILLRPYFQGGMANDPAQIANWCCDFLEDKMNRSKHIVIGNELNIEGPFEPTDPNEWRRMNDWILRTTEIVRHRLPQAIIHFPALSPGHGDDSGIMDPPGLTYCREAVESCDILGQHVYWPPRHAERFRPWFGRRMLWHHRLFPKKFIFISEAGPTDVRPKGTAEDLIEFFRILEAEFPYVLGACLFSWNWG